jgi:alkylation response protein AidB-like acyl-CoA dehydrogenase
MNFDITDDQEMMRDMFARFLNEQSSTARVRAALPVGFDAALWKGLGELGALGLRVPEVAGGLGLGLLDANVLMWEAGRTLVSGPLAEALVAARLLGQLGGPNDILARVMSGEIVATLALHDLADMPIQWIAGGLVADVVVARKGDDVVLIIVPASARHEEDTLAETPLAEIDLGALPHTVLGSGADALATFSAGIEEWKLNIAAALAGLAREALRLAANYACERKAFGQFIGTFQGISHPLADLLCEVDGGKFLSWRAIRSIADGAPHAAAQVSLTAWWNAETAGRVVAQAVQTFGGYGLATEYDVHLYNLRAKAWPLVWGDPKLWLEEAGRRMYVGEKANLPEAGEVSIEFDLGEDAAAIKQEVHDFFAKHVTDEMREKFHYSWEGYNPVLHKKLAEAGLLFPSWPKDMGGRGISPYAKTSWMEAFEEEGYNTPVANVAAMVGAIIHRFGSDELKRDVLERIVSGDVLTSLGYSEPGGGSDVFAAQCKATPDGNGWRIDGTKMWTSGANLTDYVLMLCRTNPDVPKHKGLTMFIVPLKAEGVTVQAVHTFMNERTNITFYDGVKIPDSYRLGEVDGGVKTMSVSLELEHGGGFNKVQRAMLEAAVVLCGGLRRNGRPLIEDGGAQQRLARTAAHVMICDLLGFRTAWSAMEGKPSLAFGPMIKMFSSEKFLTDSRDLLDLAAPVSLSKRQGPVKFLNQCYRHAHGSRIYGGTSEVHRSMIAERGLGLPRTRA